MTKLEIGYKTQIAYNKIEELDIDSWENDLPNLDYMLEFDSQHNFVDGLKKYSLKKFNFDADANGEKEFRTFLIKKFKEENFGDFRVNVTNWLGGKAPALNPNARENIYKICFLFKMNINETYEFFTKYYLERPFNFKNINESVYYFCIKNGKNYYYAQNLIKRINNTTLDNINEDNLLTENIHLDLENINSEDELINYLMFNKKSFANQNITSVEKIKELLNDDIKLANKKFGNVKSIDSLLNAIYCYSAREKHFGKNVFDNSIKDSAFPLLIKRNFPQRQTFENILKGNGSYESIRKTLIMLQFINFFIDDFDNDNLDDDDLYIRYENFISESDEMLLKCGYQQMYFRNPYDWMIAYCAISYNPIDTLQNLISELYLGA